MTMLKYELVQLAAQRSSLLRVARHMFSLMIQNMSSDEFVFADPVAPGAVSIPGCIIAAPSYTVDCAPGDQNYVINLTRIAAVAALELAAANVPSAEGEGAQALIDYVNFASICQNNASTIGHGCYTIEAQPHPWPEQSDGPALQTMAILRAYPKLDGSTKTIARTVIDKNVEYLLSKYKGPTMDVWKERVGYSFFARSVQLRCFQEITRNTYGIKVPQAIFEAVAWLQKALQDHWNGACYVSILSPSRPSETPPVDLPYSQAYDPNIDIVMASVYGAIPYSDTRLLATAAQLRRQWADTSSPICYAINIADRGRAIGPMLGRHPSDSYDGDSRDPVPGGHPWLVSTCNFAELCYGLANAIAKTQIIPIDKLSEDFFRLVEIDADTQWREAITSLRRAGDEMLYAIIFHSDHLELGEQFDGTIGYGKGVRDSTWSYAAFLSAVRERTDEKVHVLLHLEFEAEHL